LRFFVFDIMKLFCLFANEMHNCGFLIFLVHRACLHDGRVSSIPWKTIFVKNSFIWIRLWGQPPYFKTHQIIYKSSFRQKSLKSNRPQIALLNLFSSFECDENFLSCIDVYLASSQKTFQRISLDGTSQCFEKTKLSPRMLFKNCHTKSMNNICS
jgi:hypothetical protein